MNQTCKFPSDLWTSEQLSEVLSFFTKFCLDWGTHMSYWNTFPVTSISLKCQFQTGQRWAALMKQRPQLDEHHFAQESSVENSSSDSKLYPQGKVKSILI